MLNKFVKIGLSLLLTISLSYSAAKINYADDGLYPGDDSIYEITEEDINYATKELENSILTSNASKAEKCINAGADKFHQILIRGARNLNPSVLLYAIGSCSPDIISLLIKYKFPLCLSGEITTELIEAVKAERENIVEFLLRTISDTECSTKYNYINATDERGNTALMYTIMDNIYSRYKGTERESIMKKIASLLLINGADIDIKNKNNKAAIDIAIENNKIDWVKFLLYNQATITPEHLAITLQSDIPQEIKDLIKNEPNRRAAALFKQNEIIYDVTKLPDSAIGIISSYVPQVITDKDFTLEHELKTKNKIMRKLLVSIIGSISSDEKGIIINTLKRKKIESNQTSSQPELDMFSANNKFNQEIIETLLNDGSKVDEKNESKESAAKKGKTS